MRTIAAAFTGIMILVAGQGSSAGGGDERYRDEVERFRQKREADLKADDGWLTVSGLHWLRPGQTSIGSDPSNDLLLPARLPGSVGTLSLTDGKVEFRAAPAVSVTRNGSPFDHGQIHSDADEHPDTLAVGDVKLILLKRGERLAVRIKDNQSPQRAAFAGLRWYPVRDEWRIQARFVAAPAATKLKMDTIVGETDVVDSPGDVTFERSGKTYRLQAAGQKDGRLWFVFRDGTSGRTTHGGARQLYAEPPQDGVVALDFNKATNFPCAYIPYATCPLAPARNRLSLAIEAGELSMSPIAKIARLVKRGALPGEPSRRIQPDPTQLDRSPGLEGTRGMNHEPSRQPPEGGRIDQAKPPGITEEVEVRGHIVDSLLLPKILDRILLMGGTFEIRECKIGVRRADASYARIAIRAESHEILSAILGDLVEHGASPMQPEDVTTLTADISGAFPEGFYSTTSQPTQVRLMGRWIDVLDQEMDCGIVVEHPERQPRCIPMYRVTVGMPIVVGHKGVRVLPVERSREVSMFGFMSSTVSSEKPKSISVRGVVDAIRSTRAAGKKVLLVGGPAIVHTGSAGHVARLIREGWIQVLFAGNALATHDMEQAMYGTSLGVSLVHGEPIEHGHEHHLRTINTIRRLGGIAQAVEKDVIKSGIMYECVKAGIEVVLAGSIRDDGPLPEVITDSLAAQDRMRQSIHEVGFALLIATALHSIATGNLLPAWVKVVCVDINPATVTKLSDRGTFQTIGLVTDVEPFLRSLAAELAPWAEQARGAAAAR